LIDLDRFKAVNDTYGHEVGDHLMRAVAERLRASVRDGDVVLRYAGDEFVVLVGGVPHHRVAERVASRVIELLEVPFEFGQDRIQVSASIGIAIDDGTQHPADLVRDADAAMYQAKSHRPGTYVLFEPSMRDRLTPVTAQRRMREAFDAGRFSVVYRPVVSLRTAEVIGVEAEVRWNEPERGDIGRAELALALEQTGLIVPVGAWLLREACRQSRSWSDSFPARAPLDVMVPVTLRELSQSDFVDRVRHALAGTSAVPATIVLCIDEASLAGDMGMLRQTARGVRTLGVRIAVVDRGTGLRSLGHARDIDVDVVVLEASTVASAGADHRDAAVVAHVVSLAKALGAVTVATGVEHAPQVEALRAAGCELVSGRLLAPPLAPAMVEALVRRSGPRPAPAAATVADAAGPAEV
jgi:diguanylate cyclase (GGDEF)-like protein